MNIFKASRFLAMVAIVATFWACDQKDDASPDQNEVVGKWKLEDISGGFVGSGYDANWNYLELKADLTYRRLQNGNLAYQGTYAIQKKDGKTFIDFKSSPALSNSPFEDQEKEAVFEKDQLTLSDPCCDLFQYEFSKAKN